MSQNIKLCEVKGCVSDIVFNSKRCGGKRLECMLAIRIAYEKKNHIREQMSFSFHSDLLNTAGLMIGDKINLEIGEHEWRLFRDKKGWSLFKCNGSQKSRAYMKMSFSAGVLDGIPTGTCRNIRVSPGSISFELPEKQ